jgi:tetratricopeptide (TPR) repeat protein
MTRPPRILHATSEPLRFFGRSAELALLDSALAENCPSVVALVGPGGQGKTAIVQHWLHALTTPVDGLFLWSFYRGKDADLCLREWLAYAEGLPALPEVSASWCVDRLLAVLRRERWAVVLDGAEVVQYEDGPWRGRFLHPDLARLLEEMASAPMPGAIALTTRFDLPTLQRRPAFRLVSLDRLDLVSARELLASLGVTGNEHELDALAASAGRHAKAVELLGTYVVRAVGPASRAGPAVPLGSRHLQPVGPASRAGPAVPLGSRHLLPPEEADEETSVARVLGLFQQALPPDEQDVLALATSFREPPSEALLLDYLASPAVRALLHQTWGRAYRPFAGRDPGWLARCVQELVALRLLERVGPGEVKVIDAHPLVRRAFEHVAGPAGRRENALARAGFLRGRPDRRRPDSLEQAREAIELFHAHCDAGLWNEADGTLLALENPKHRFLAPAVERDLLLRFFPGGDWHQPPLWPGFGRWRSLAICLEMLGRYEEALEVYRPADAPLRGDALIALGRLGSLLEVPQVQAPWQTLWQSYRCHALCLAGRIGEALALARSLVPVDIYEWVHVFECLLRADALNTIDLRSVLFRPAGGDHRWAELARRRMRADYLRRTAGNPDELGEEYPALLDAYDRAGLPWERALTRLSYATWLLDRDRPEEGGAVHAVTQDLIALAGLIGLAMDGWTLAERIAVCLGEEDTAAAAHESRQRRAEATGIMGPARP